MSEAYGLQCYPGEFAKSCYRRQYRLVTGRPTIARPCSVTGLNNNGIWRDAIIERQRISPFQSETSQGRLQVVIPKHDLTATMSRFPSHLASENLQPASEKRSTFGVTNISYYSFRLISLHKMNTHTQYDLRFDITNKDIA